MNKTWKLLTIGSLVVAMLASGCAAPKAFGPTNLTTQQLHNVAQPASSGSWLPKFMQPSAPKPTFGASDNLSTLNATADTTQNKGVKGKKSDPLTMARLQERRGQTEQAIKIYERELATSPRKAHIHHRLAVMAGKSGEWDKARAHFEQAVRLEPKNSEILGDLGYALYLQHQLSDAEACLLAAVEANPRNKVAQNNLGIVLGVQGKFEESLAAFRRAVPDAEAHANLGYVHMQLGDANKAMDELNHALSLDRGLRTAALALVQMNDLKKRLGPQDLDRMTLATKQPKGSVPVPANEARPLEQAQPPETMANTALAADVSAARFDSRPTVIPEQQVAEPSVFQRQLAGYMASDLKVRESQPAQKPEAIASATDSRIKEIPERLPAPSSFVDLSHLANRNLPVSSPTTSESKKLAPLMPMNAAADASRALQPEKEPDSQPIAAFAEQANSVVLASAQVNSVALNRAPALLSAPGPHGAPALTSQPSIDQQPVTVHKPSVRFQQLREQDRAAAQPRKVTSHIDHLLALKHNEDRNSLQANNVIVNQSAVPVQPQTPTVGNIPDINADLISAVHGAQSVGSKSSIVKPTMGANPSLVPQANMPRPEEMILRQDQMNQLPTHKLHPTANPTWTAPSMAAPSSTSIETTKGPLPRVKVLPN